MSKIFYLSDTHFNHAKIITLCNRPFANVDEMNDTLIENINNTVSDDDLVRFLGDFAWSDHVYFFKQLHGSWEFIRGNHDEAAEGLGWLRKDDYREVKDGEYKLKLFHYPITEWNGFYKGHYHFYGHVHTNKMMEQPLNWRARAFNVGAEALDYRPQTATEIIMAGNE